MSWNVFGLAMSRRIDAGDGDHKGGSGKETPDGVVEITSHT